MVELSAELGLCGSRAVAVRQKVDKDSITHRAVTDVEYASPCIQLENCRQNSVVMAADPSSGDGLR